MARIRLIYDLPIEVQWPDGRIVQCRSHDIDQESITIKSPFNAKAGTRLKLHFKVLVGSTPQPITTHAVAGLSYLVGAENLFHIHLHFKELDSQQQGYIETFIRERKRT